MACSLVISFDGRITGSLRSGRAGGWRKKTWRKARFRIGCLSIHHRFKLTRQLDAVLVNEVLIAVDIAPMKTL